MAIVGIESVTYGVDDVVASVKFADDFGLTKEDQASAGATFRTQEGSLVNIRKSNDGALPPAIEGVPTIREVVWGVDSAEQLRGLAAALANKHKVTQGSDGVVRLRDPDGLAIGLTVSKIDRTRAFAPPSQQPRVNRSIKEIPRAQPYHTGHVVFFTSSLETTSRFYQDELGFQVSDTYRGLGVFLRAEGATNHHNLFLIKRDTPGVNHLSFRVEGLDELMVGKEYLESKGWRLVWGPGRHTVASDLFVYFDSPAGGLFEYHADEDCILDPSAWKPREWSPLEERVEVWGSHVPLEVITGVKPEPSSKSKGE